MEIIKNNFKPVRSKIRSKKVRCKYCRSRLKVTYDDLMMYYAETIEAGYFFKCPCCEEKLEISFKEGQKLKKHS